MRRVDRLNKANELYQHAIFGADPAAVIEAHQLLDTVEADLALARGRLLHAQFLLDRQPDPRELELFERAVALYAAQGSVRGQAQSLFCLALYHQVVCDDPATAEPLLERSHELASQLDDRLLVSYVVRHLGFANLAAGRRAVGHEQLLESVRLRRELGHQPGLAAGLLALAQFADEDGRKDDADALLAEATELATGSAAHGVLGWIDSYRASR